MIHSQLASTGLPVNLTIHKPLQYQKDMKLAFRKQTRPIYCPVYPLPVHNIFLLFFSGIKTKITQERIKTKEFQEGVKKGWVHKKSLERQRMV